MALKQGKYTFRYNVVIREIVSKNFYLQYRISGEERTEFHQICQERYEGLIGTLHNSTDWILIADLDKRYNFPLHIAYTELQPDITIYSNSAKKMILIELTCLCAENMEKWHDHEINKYLPLKSAINFRDWEVDLFAIEEGVRGLPSSSLLCCLQNIGFINILA